MTTIAAMAPVTRRVRAYFAPVDRMAGIPAIFDAAQTGMFPLDQPPAPWIDLGWCTKFTRKSSTKVGDVLAGAPAAVQSQIRSEIAATVSMQFESWGKLQLALAAGSQQMNLLQTLAGAAASGSGGTAAAAAALTPGGANSATQVDVGSTAAMNFPVGSLIAVDVDYAGQTGFVGSGISAAYVRSSTAVGGDPNYVRRITLNVGRVIGVSSGILQLAAPLTTGVPTMAMKVSALSGFVDREGGSFFHEWSGLFVMPGEQGDRAIFHYPRLQAMQGAAEVMETLAGPLETARLAGGFRALPVVDANDGESVLCFRSYLPSTTQLV